LNQSLLKPGSYKFMQTDVLLDTGDATGYGFGLQVRGVGGKRRFSHGGAVSGYTTSNLVYPDDKVAITAFTNIYPGAADAPGAIANRVAGIIMPPPAANATAMAQAQRIYADLMKGMIDRSLFTASANAFFTADVLADYATSLGPLGAPAEFTAGGESLRGGMVIRGFRIRAGGVTMSLTMMTLPDGKIDQYIVARAG
jgi:D-alanyl-D-alanine carboxypeptidase